VSIAYTKGSKTGQRDQLRFIIILMSSSHFVNKIPLLAPGLISFKFSKKRQKAQKPRKLLAFLARILRMAGRFLFKLLETETHRHLSLSWD
jgi:hypothetical protein